MRGTSALSSILIDYGKIESAHQNTIVKIMRVLFHEITHHVVFNMFGWGAPYKEGLYTTIFGEFGGFDEFEDVDTHNRHQLRYDNVITKTLSNIHNFFDQVDQKKILFRRMAVIGLSMLPIS